MFEAQFWKLLRNSEVQPKFTISYKKICVLLNCLKMNLFNTVNYLLKYIVKKILLIRSNYKLFPHQAVNQSNNPKYHEGSIAPTLYPAGI